ncbi:Pentapeptide repeat-containing protein [Micromonospora viridifaciens]|uniref:Pentapeptide repeat-containing protein n=1 Tax=Micromonospora viridifaciens TaxID=1881 RepID=A0A1C4Z8G1_MICVI|nr:pentapeptide repeat-containing protein [Micromonospora viridifaciens]SCF29219.1 Pentapeptide repeat-containing protein [Micromonospora viridifaciens]
MGLRRYWLARGELNGGRFEVTDANLDVSFAQVRMVGVDFSGLRFSGFLAHDSVFESCDFSRTAFDHVLFGATGYGGGRWDELSWPATVYRECVFSRTRIPPQAYFGNARFERCVFDGARLRDLTSRHKAQFVECTFRGKIQDVNFWGIPTERTAALGRDRNAFTGNDFASADLLGVAFKHIDLHAQEFPGMPEYAVLDRVDQRVAAALAAVAVWPNDDIKTKAARSLRLGANEAIEYNDGHALASRSWVGRRLPPDVRDQIFWMLVNYSDDQQ